VIHAHPDDETIDAGVLIGRASLAGLKTAVVVLTDGESGIDQYPHRSVGGRYPERDLAGAELAEVRVRECAEAIRTLGGAAYVRLGLPNSPYNSEDDTLTHDDVLGLWGGSLAMVDRIAAILAELNPTVVVAPEGPSEAHEHFEHETTGTLVELAVGSLRASFGDALRLKGFLQTVDPLQARAGRPLVRVPETVPGPDGPVSLRALQAAALSRHETQRDATVVAVERLVGYEAELYRPVFWEVGRTVVAYLSPSSG
jgi:LmbE family N-acetylglucosaminyl deacetylase